MKIGMNLYLWTSRLEASHFPLLDALKTAGFDGVEIPTGDYSAAEISAIRAALEQSGLACTVATLLDAEHNPLSVNTHIRRAADDKIKKDLELSHALGAEVLVGPVHSGHKVFTGTGPNVAEFELAVEFLKRAGQSANDAGLKLAVEPLNRFECYFLNTAKQAKTLTEAVDIPSVGILYDTHHANIEEDDVGSAIRSLGDHLFHFHVSESHRGTPGTGAVNWQDSFSALKHLDYKGWLMIEAFATDVEGIPQAVNLWRNCFENKSAVYTKGRELILQYLSQ